MAKIIIAGDAVIVKSALKFEDLNTVKRYRPEALVLMGGEDNKDPVFAIDTVNGKGSISKYGASFGSESHDEEKLATITMVVPTQFDGDIKDYVTDNIGAAIINLNKLEENLPTVIQEIANEKAKVIESITEIW